MHYDYNRRTGRTTKTLRMAIDAALCGKNVVYICHSNLMADCAKRMALELLKNEFKYSGATVRNELFIHRRSTGIVEFISVKNPNITLENYPTCLRGCSNQCFVDHVVWEEAGWRPSHQKRNEPSHKWSNLKLEEQFTWAKKEPKWSKEGYERLWQALFPGSAFGHVQSAAQQMSKDVATSAAKKPYMSSANGDMRDKFPNGGPLL